MCGIVGAFGFKNNVKDLQQYIQPAAQQLSKRGPDNQNTIEFGNAVLGHARLSIIDTSSAGNQPMYDETGRYAIIFNGEIYNYKLLKKDLEQKGYTFSSGSDTEVLLKLYIEYKEDCLEKLNGFFGFAVYDKQSDELFIARDRMGIKPMLYFLNDNMLVFASEMKAILQFPINKELNYNAAYTYFQLNYIPGYETIIKGIQKLLPGHYISIKNNKAEIKQYYKINDAYKSKNYASLNYEDAKNKLNDLMHQSIQRRLIADVPLGSFLSGGIDSSVVAYLSSQYSPNINTFSVGFKDEPYFDETQYANLVAKKIKTNHTVFSLSNDDLFAEIFSILDYLDEPFADSSAIAVYILCKQTKQKITVALSGDGADEIFGGYNKHHAELRARQTGLLNNLVKLGKPVWGSLPKSRNSKASNIVRQLSRFAEGLSLNNQERYWRWCAFVSEDNAKKYFRKDKQEKINFYEYNKLKNLFLQHIKNEESDLNDMLYADMNLILPNDMLQKVDLMSMANSLEVRVPFLDHEVVDFAFSLPAEYKIDSKRRKKILVDTYKEFLPEEIFSRPKHGFEVPLLKWFRNELKSLIEDDLLNDAFVEQQGIFDENEIKRIKTKLYSNNPEDAHAQIWALIVFQYWWKKYFN
jgi:asparagine synthase (glutamine-hydrolysing)